MIFEMRLQKHFDGGDSEFPLPKQWRNLAEEFRKLLADSPPRLNQSSVATLRANVDNYSRETPTPARGKKQSYSIPIEIDSASDNEVPRRPMARSDKKRVHGASPETPMKRLKMSDIPLHTSPATIDTTCKRSEDLLLCVH